MKNLKVYIVKAHFEVEVEADNHEEAEEIGKHLMLKNPNKVYINTTLNFDCEYVEKGGKL